MMFGWGCMYTVYTSDISSLSDDERPNAISALNKTGNIDTIVVKFKNQTFFPNNDAK